MRLQAFAAEGTLGVAGRQPRPGLQADGSRGQPLLFTNVQVVPGVHVRLSNDAVTGHAKKVPVCTLTRTANPGRGAAIRFVGVSHKDLGDSGVPFSNIW